MKKVFLDTNVILDFYLGRENYCDDAEKILALGYAKVCSLFISALTFANVAYIARKKFPGDAIYTLLEGMQELVSVTSVDAAGVQDSINLRAKDFEDSLQYFSAKGMGVDCIVTRNVKDFASFDIDIFTPKEFLMQF